MYSTAKRISDGLLGWVQNSPQQPDTAAVILNMGVNVLGGVVGDYAYQELTDEQGAAILAAMPARSKLVDGVLSHATAPSVSFSAGQVEADGVSEITLTVDCHDAAYNGAVTVKINPPDSPSITEILTAVAGVATDSISTQVEGVHQVEVSTILHGVGFASFEGV